MIVRSGTEVTFPIMFSSGHPDGNIIWKVYDEDGVVLNTGTIVVPVDAVSANLRVASAHNTLIPGTLTAFRDVEWTYDVSGQVVNGEVRYTVEERMPYGVSAGGVRNKLGVTVHDLPDEDIYLVNAVLHFTSVVTPVDPLTTAQRLIVCDAIEATAALAVLPSMQVRVANKESSGTDQFTRQKIDWEALRLHLEGVAAAGYIAIDPLFDPSSTFGALFLIATPSADPLTGGSYG